MKKSVVLLLSLLFILLLLKSPSLALGAASLTLSPASQSVTVGQTFTVNINLNTGGAATTGVDGIITFNPAVLSVSNIAIGSLYSGSQLNQTIDAVGGKIAIHPGVTSSAYAYNGQGVLATITFSGKATGTSQVAFTCTVNVTQNDTNVWSGSNDIVSCTETTGGSYTVTGGTNPTNTPTPTIVNNNPTATPTTANNNSNPTPTPPGNLMDAGIEEWTFLLLATGLFLTFGGVKLLLVKNA